MIHRTRLQHEADFTVKDGIPVTSLARTYLDLAATASERQLEAALAEGERLRVVDLDALDQTLERSRGRKGRRKLRGVLARWNPELADANVGLEEQFLDLCRRHSLPMPLCNTMVEGVEVDCLWRGQRLIVELDSARYHGNVPALTSDYSRDMKLRAAGYEVHRYTYSMVNRSGRRVAESVRLALSTRGGST